MSINIMSFKPTGIRACSSSDHRRSTSNRSNNNNGSPNWWSPIFGWSNEPDYIEDKDEERKTELDRVGTVTDKKIETNRIVAGSFTEEKAKKLRLMTQGTSNFHDVMYHSAIASRLASDFERRQANGRDL